MRYVFARRGEFESRLCDHNSPIDSNSYDISELRWRGWLGDVNLSDGVSILGYLFSGLVGPSCLDALDVNDDGSVNIADASVVFRFLFSGGSEPFPPYPNEGLDPTPDDLSCE